LFHNIYFTFSGYLRDSDGNHDFSISLAKTCGLAVRLIYKVAGTPPSTITDYDGNIYDVIEIGGYYWTKQNWKSTRLENGDSIPNTTSIVSWNSLTTPGRCAYSNSEIYV